jgi:hypothetical protein
MIIVYVDQVDLSARVCLLKRSVMIIVYGTVCCVLAGAVESCLSQGLRRRALGLFKTSSTTALLHKVAKGFGPAAVISRKVQDIENCDPNRYGNT